MTEQKILSCSLRQNNETQSKLFQRKEDQTKMKKIKNKMNIPLSTLYILINNKKYNFNENKTTK